MRRRRQYRTRGTFVARQPSFLELTNTSQTEDLDDGKVKRKRRKWEKAEEDDVSLFLFVVTGGRQAA